MKKIADTVSVEKSLKLKGKLENLDYLRGNLDEIEVVLGLVDIQDSESVQALSVKKRMQKIKDFYAENTSLPELIITAGKDGAYYLKQNETGFEIEHFKAEKVTKTELVETTGAGDALTAGFAAGLMKDYSMAESIKLGIKASALTIKSELTCNPELAKLK